MIHVPFSIWNGGIITNALNIWGVLTNIVIKRDFSWHSWYYVYIIFMSSASRTVDCLLCNAGLLSIVYVSCMARSVPLYIQLYSPNGRNGENKIVFLNWYWLLISWHFLSPKRKFYFTVDKDTSPAMSRRANRGDRSTPMTEGDDIHMAQWSQSLAR